ncbi:hypothetical protein C8R43DRAFT_1238538 [Mycena crocata]|nr:hypothetical protein C8R43DRAFT_1238538 [Mycena crocata]
MGSPQAFHAVIAMLVAPPATQFDNWPSRKCCWSSTFTLGIHTIDSITFHVLVTHSAAFNLVRYSGGPASRVCGPKELSRISLAVSMTCRRRSITRRRCGVGLFPRGSTKILRSKSVKLINLLFRFQPQLCLGRLFVVNTLLLFVSPPFLFSILHTRTC